MIDRVKFDEYCRFFDKEVIAGIIDLFIIEHPVRIENLRKNLEDKDYTAMAENLHSLKGSIATFMAPVPLDLTRKLEILAKAQSGEDLPELFRELVSVTERLILELREIRKEFIS
jgi:HPt (histidine-containing phosphotransfer) domain-containing protein